MSESKKILLIGLPETGKSTFVAALWHLVDGRNETILTLDQLQGDREYLNSIRDKWIVYEKLDRTLVGNEFVASIRLVNRATSQTLELTIPDLSGETFKSQWSKRSWTNDFEALIRDSNGILLFIHPNQLDEPIRVEQAEAIVKEIVKNSNERETESPIELSEWDPEESPTQVKLVELLQFIEDARVTPFPYKVAVIISAWDLVKNNEQEPTKWLKKRLPLLHQYLSAKRECFTCQIYGVSAQGEEYSEEARQRLASHMNAANRIQIVGQNYSGHDLTVPLAWLLNKN